MARVVAFPSAANCPIHNSKRMSKPSKKLPMSLSLFDFIDEANLHRPEYLPTGSTRTAGYSAPNPPPPQQIPSHLVIDAQLPQKMRGRLQSYLAERSGPQLASERLQTRLNLTQASLVDNLPRLTNETTSILFFARDIEPLVSDFVLEVDHVGVQLEQADTSFGARPDSIWGGRVHVEFKSPRALLHHAPEILAIARANNGNGSPLELGPAERDGRSIIFKVLLPISRFRLLSNDMSDWNRHGHKELNLGDSYLRSSLHILSSTCSTRCERRDPSHSVLF